MPGGSNFVRSQRTNELVSRERCKHVSSSRGLAEFPILLFFHVAVRVQRLLRRVSRLSKAEAEAESLNAKNKELESELEALRDATRQRDAADQGSARESEEIMVALQGQVDSANQVHCTFLSHLSGRLFV